MNYPNLRKRVGFSLVALPIAWVIINSTQSLLPPRLAALAGLGSDGALMPGHLLAFALITLACREYLSMMGHAYPKNGFWLAYVWLALDFMSQIVPSPWWGSHVDTYLLLLLAAAESALWGASANRWERACLLVGGLLFLSIASGSLVRLYQHPFQDAFAGRFSHPMLSQVGIIVLLASVFLCDTVAYFVGTYWGRRHFTSISPNKTIEGCIGGFLAALLTSTIGWHLAAVPRHPLYEGLLLGALVGVFAQLGDLFVSLIKRHFRVKDASNMIPGHGGILDRFDSLFFTAPAVNLFFAILAR